MTEICNVSEKRRMNQNEVSSKCKFRMTLQNKERATYFWNYVNIELVTISANREERASLLLGSFRTAK